MKKVILIASMGMLVFASCKKKGCTDKYATNYNSEFKKDDGSCTYPTKVSFEFLEVKSYPNVNDNGVAWDAFDGTSADIFVQLEDESHNVLHKTYAATNSTNNLWGTDKITMGIYDEVWFYLYDEDALNDEFIGLDFIDFENYTKDGVESDKYPYSIETSYGGCTFVLSGITWF